MRFEPPAATCFIFTFKEGFLSRIAHDLRIRVARFWIEVEADRIRAEFDARSLEVETAMKDGRPHDALGPADRDKIRATIANDVLETGRFPTVVFESSSFDGGTIRGSLTLHGTTRSIALPIEKSGNLRKIRWTLHQPDFGIAPYRAALGALKLKPDVIVELTLPE
jgi:polyisoprenoid-binding protein YceI